MVSRELCSRNGHEPRRVSEAIEGGAKGRRHQCSIPMVFSGRLGTRLDIPSWTRYGVEEEERVRESKCASEIRSVSVQIDAQSVDGSSIPLSPMSPRCVSNDYDEEQ